MATQTVSTHSVVFDRAEGGGGAGPAVKRPLHSGQVSTWSRYSLRNPFRRRSGQASFEQCFISLASRWRDPYHWPPSMRNTSPVIHAASSEAR